MTVHDIIKTAFALEYEDIESDKDALRHSIEVLNTLLIDCFDAENNSRECEGRELLTEVPFVRALTDDVPYNAMLIRYTLPYGLEWKYAEQNLDQYRADQYKAMYDDTKMIAGRAVWL
jgi:hypothetical protein